ncbi:MAG: peptidylprolyl isomerase [Gammaproteobacteria bacterium]|nr:peptidylprolyl isomerase [Gammaproteobacteria bacterium]
MVRTLFLALLAMLPGALALAADDAPRVRVTTSMGAFVIELDPKRAPLTVENFLGYVRDGHYSGTLFHRVVANFVIQGGGVDREYRMKPPRAPVPNESGNGLRNVRGAVGLARTERPHSGDAQFYVDVADNPDLDPLPSRWGYAVFGHIVEGMEVVDRISVAPTGAAGPFPRDAPLRPIVIESIELLAPAPSESATP